MAARKPAATTLLEIKKNPINDPINETINLSDNAIKEISGTIKPISGTIKPISGTIKPGSGTIKQGDYPINYPINELLKQPCAARHRASLALRILTQFMPRWGPERPRPPALASSPALCRECTLPRKQTAYQAATL